MAKHNDNLGRLTVGCLLALLLLGCSSKPARVRPPKFDVQQSADLIMAEFDSNGDGVLTKSEAFAGIVSDWGTYDTDSDGKITVEEIARRFREWRDSDTGLMNIRCEVTWNGTPLTEAVVEMEPLPMLGDNFFSARGTTDRYGFAFVNVEEAPASLAGTFGMQLGLYTVRITHPTVSIPEKYNTQTTLGVDLSPADANSGLAFHLRP